MRYQYVVTFETDDTDPHVIADNGATLKGYLAERIGSIETVNESSVTCTIRQRCTVKGIKAQ